MKTFEKAPRKREVRELMIPRNSFSTIVGLPGPNIDLCVQDYFDRGFKNILLWEFDFPTFLQQIKRIPQGVKLHYGNILEAPILQDCFYDLDFFCTMKKCQPFIEKFTNNFALTVAVRTNEKFYNIEKALFDFVHFRGEQVVDIIQDKPHWHLSTNKNKYLAVNYRDSSQMFTIKKLN